MLDFTFARGKSEHKSDFGMFQSWV